MAPVKHLSQAVRYYCVCKIRQQHSCKLLIVGAGAGGCSTAWRFARRLKEHDIIILEPSAVHYNQPLFTLVAAGIKKFSDTCKSTESVLPSCVGWMKDHAEDFDPCNNTVYTRCGDKIVYNYMVVAVGLKNDYEMIPGLKQALDSTCPVTTIYSPEYCKKTCSLIQQFKGGHAVFTYPMCGGKCSGAAQKIMYLADDYWRKNKIRPQTSITYATGMNCIFGVPKYARALTQVAAARDIAVVYNAELNEVTKKKEPTLVVAAGYTFTLPYNFLHVAPPMSPPICLSKCTELVTERGYLDVDKYTLQHRYFPNVYGLGDCLCTPNSKTAAAVSGQSYVVEQNLAATMNGQEPPAMYNGYGACPMLTSYKTGILAEFLYNKEVCETFPFDQSVERRFFFFMKKNILPYMYWQRLIKGKWNGPTTLRKMINPFKR